MKVDCEKKQSDYQIYLYLVGSHVDEPGISTAPWPHYSTATYREKSLNNLSPFAIHKGEVLLVMMSLLSVSLLVSFIFKNPNRIIYSSVFYLGCCPCCCDSA